ncbi:MAG: hypothetical protein SWY16_04580 [Cyanobacteriota bacterium]|nr:hypothetical protein [Cyanobacteriota bacterium]
MSDFFDFNRARIARALKNIKPLSVEITSVDMMDIQIPSEEQKFDVETVQERAIRKDRESEAMLRLDPEAHKEFVEGAKKLFKKMEAARPSAPSLSKPIDLGRLTKKLDSARQRYACTSEPPVSS